MKSVNENGIVIAILISITFTSGCLERCPGSCDDGNPCTYDYCNPSTRYKCDYTALIGPSEGCSGEVGGCGFYVCSRSNCTLDYKVNCCGNEKCESMENYSTCPGDCLSCDDGNRFTTDSFNYLSQRCENYHNYTYNTTVAGVNIYSTTSFSELKNWKNIVLSNPTNKAATTCNLELLAISTQYGRRYRVYVESGDAGVYVNNTSAYILWQTEDDILDACHAFACLRDNLICPDDLQRARDIVLNAKSISVIIDGRVREAGVRGYQELFGVLGYIQAQEALKDTDGDGEISRQELEDNLLLIYPYIMNGSTCTSQPFNSILQRVNITGNETFDCDKLDPSIQLISSDRNEIKITDDRITISGGDEEIHTAAVIIRDVLSPQYIRKIYGIE